MAFRTMRRAAQQLPEAESIAILQQASSGVLALAGDDGYPYALPMSYVYAQGKLFFHSARTGHKIDAIRGNDKASFCVIAEDTIVPEAYTTHFRSVIAFGRIRPVEDAAQKQAAMELLAAKYRPGFAEDARAVIRRQDPALCVLELCIEHLTGKEAIELTKNRKPQ